MRYLVLVSLFLFIGIAVKAEVAIIEVKNASIGQIDGKIVLLADGSAGPFSVDLYKDDVVLGEHSRTGVSGLHMFEDLMPGNYTVWVTDRFGCETVLDVEIFQDQCVISLTIVEIKNPSYCNYCNGQSGVNPCSDDGQIALGIETNVSAYTIIWHDLFRNQEVTTTDLLLTNVLPGLHRIRVISDDGSCEAEQMITIDACVETDADCSNSSSSTDGLVFNDPHILGTSEPGADDGAIIANIHGITSRHNVFWTDESTGEILGNSPFLYEVGVGRYCINVQDGCTQGVEQRCYEITCVLRHKFIPSIDYTGDCASGPTLSVDLEDIDNSLFTFEWDDGTTGTSISTPEFREYCVTISDPGSDCTQEYCISPAVPGFRIIEIIGLCPDAIDGEITLEISNPLNEDVTLEVDGIDFTYLIGSNQTVNITSLRGGICLFW